MTAMEQMGKRAKEAAAVLAVAGRKKTTLFWRSLRRC